MEWIDEGIVLSARRHGESSAVVSVLTRDHGRHAALVRGARGGRLKGVAQPGNQVRLRWRARLAAHLGTFTCELERSAAALLASPDRLAALAAACAILDSALPEREPLRRAYDGLAFFLSALADDEGWPAAYVRWEVDLLATLGFGLDLERCAATGRQDDLAYVSPKTGRAVSRSAGQTYSSRLLPLPAFLVDRNAAATARDIVDGLALTGSFLASHVYQARGGALPAARVRLAERLAAGLGERRCP